MTKPDVTDRQLDVLQWIAEDCPPGRWPAEDYSYKTTSVALANRGLVRLRGRGRNWGAEITADGKYYLEHRRYPDGHPRAPKPRPERITTGRRRSTVAKPVKKAKVQREDEFEIDSPRRLRARGRNLTPSLPDSVAEHPWEDKVLISVKEAAWLVSVSEHLIRQAVLAGDIHRVFIGGETRHYRIVHASLLAWINTLPTTARGYYDW